MFTRDLILSCTVLLTMNLALTTKALAQSEKLIFFNIPETTVDKALNRLGQQANVPVLFPFDEVKALRSRGLNGYYTIAQALECVTHETGLTSKLTERGAIVVAVSSAEKSTYKVNIDSATGVCLAAQQATNLGKAATRRQSDGFYLEEITVTSRRFKQTLKDAPMSVTSVSGQSLRNRSESNIVSISKLAPNTNFTTAGAVSGSTSAAVIYMRGVGQNDYVPVTDPGVGVYVDDVYYGRSIGAALNLIDINQIEVLRGPQGTLFGRNTIGGAISIKTNDPSGDQSGKLRLVVGDQGREEAYFHQNFSLDDSINGNVSLARLRLDGTVERVNVPDSPKLGDENSYGARTKFEWSVSERLRLLVAADYSQEREQSAPEVNLQFHDSADLPAQWNGFTSASTQITPTSTARGCVAGQTDLGVDCYNNRFLLGPFKTGETSLSRNNIDSWGVSALADYSTLDQRWSSQLLLAHRELNAFLARQVDGSPLNIFENRESYFSQQTSLDLRVRGDLSFANFAGGLYYFSEKSDNQLDFGGALNSSLFPVHIGGRTDNQNFSVHAVVDSSITDRTHLSAGLRYTDEVKRATPNAFRFAGCNIDLAPLTPSDCQSGATDFGATDFLVPNVEQENALSKVTWSASLAYDISSLSRAYLSASTGFRSGGFEWRVADESVQEFALARARQRGLSERDALRFVRQNGALPSFEPETLTSYEVGLKSELLSQNLRYSIALFDTKYDNQIVATNPLGVATLQTNAAESSLSGAEFELLWVPNSDWTIELSIGHLDARYKKLTNDARRAGLKLDDKLIFSPKLNASIGIHYSMKSSIGALIPRINANYKSSQEFEPVNSQFARDEGYTAFDLGLRYIPRKARWDISAGIKNVGNRLYKISGDANNVIGYENVIYARPRNAYLSVRYQW